MDKKLYRRGKIARVWYNFMEVVAYALTWRPTPDDILYERHVPYGEEKSQYYNYFCRKDILCEKKPLMIYVHGGGFISGVTDMRNTYCKNFASEGYATASLSYTVAPDKVYPAPIQEICTAIDVLFDQAEEKKIDTKRILLCAESAGSYYIFMLAALASDPTLAQKLGIRFRHAADFHPAAMISHSGCVDLRRLLDPQYPQSRYPDIKMMTCSFLGKPYDEARAYLETEEGALSCPTITADFPPTFFATGCADPLRFESSDMIKEYEKLGVRYGSYEGTGALKAHAWTIVTVLKKGKECLRRSLDFVRPYLFPQSDENKEE